MLEDGVWWDWESCRSDKRDFQNAAWQRASRLQVIFLRGKLRHKELRQLIRDRAVGRSLGSIPGWSIRMHSLVWVLVEQRC